MAISRPVIRPAISARRIFDYLAKGDATRTRIINGKPVTFRLNIPAAVQAITIPLPAGVTGNTCTLAQAAAIYAAAMTMATAVLTAQEQEKAT